MRNLVIWFLVMCAGIAFGVHCYVPAISVDAVAGYQFEGFLLNFEKRLALFRDADSPRVALVGSCIAEQVPTDPPIYNLGMINGSMAETPSLIEPVADKADLILVCVSVRSLSMLDGKPRRIVTLSLARKGAILKAAVHKRFSMNPRNEKRSPVPISKERADLLRSMFPPSEYPHMRLKMLSKQVDAWAPGVSPAPTFFENMSEKYPNIVFVLMPSPWEDSYQIGNVPTINLSGALEPHHFKDLIHYTPEGNAIIGQLLSAAAARRLLAIPRSQV